MAIVITMSDTKLLESTLRLYQAKSSASEWTTIGPFVLETATAAAPLVSYPPRRIIHALCNLARACVELGWPLETATALRREVIDFAVSNQMPNLSAGSRTCVRPILLRIAEAIGPEGTPRRLAALPGSEPSRPYTSEELGELAWWARTQSGRWRCGSALALVSLGAGAGLTSSELLHLRRGDLTREPGGTTVEVRGPRPRRVPLLASWESPLADACVDLDDRDWVFRPGPRGHHLNLVTNFIAKSAGAPSARPNMQRLRATWLIRHISAGTHLIALSRAAGFSSLESLNRFMPFADAPMDELADAELRHAM